VTCIAAVSDGTRVAMAADTLTVGAWDQCDSAHKILTFGGTHIGVAGRLLGAGLVSRGGAVDVVCT